MADFFDRFVGTGTLNLHTADSGDTWDSDSSGVTLSGGAAFGSTSTPANNRMPFSSNIPPVDCSMAIVLGADWIVNRGAYGVILRGSGASGAKSYYTAIFGDAVGPAGGFGFSIYRMISGDSGTQVGTSQAFPSGPIANVQFRFSASGSGASVTLTVYQNGTQIYQVTDANAARITTAGFAGLFSGAADTIAAPDNVRAVWAGALAGPTTTITPSAPTVTVGGTQGFTAAVDRKSVV